MKRRSFFAAAGGLILSAVLPVKNGYSYVTMRGSAARLGRPIPIPYTWSWRISKDGKTIRHGVAVIPYDRFYSSKAEPPKVPQGYMRSQSLEFCERPKNPHLKSYVVHTIIDEQA